MMAEKTIFKKIIDRELPADIVYEDDLCLAFPDINPAAKVHLLIVPKKEIPSIAEAADEDQALLGHLLLTARKLAHEQGIGEAFKLQINSGSAAGQTVFHLHIHLLSAE